MEDKLTRVRTLISKNIGRSQTDLMRAFENIKEELMNLYETSIPVQAVTDGIDEKVILVIEHIHCIVIDCYYMAVLLMISNHYILDCC